MNILCHRDKFLEAVQTLARVTTTRSSIQALSGIYLKALPDGIDMVATDLDLSLRLRVEAKVEGSGGFVLPGRLLADITRALSGESVELGWDGADGAVKLRSGNAKFSLRVIPGEDFPSVPEADRESALVVSKQSFVDTEEWVVRSASNDETRPILTSVQVTAHDRTLRMVATDSYRLSVKETELEQPIADSLEVNIPARALQELGRLAVQSEGDALLVSVREGQVVFELDGISMASRLMDGQFPNYSQLLPDKFEHELHVNGRELLEVVRRIGLMAQKNSPLKLAFKRGTVTVSAQSQDYGTASESVDVPFQGDDLEIGFNAEFLRNGLEDARSDDVVLKLISSLRPAMIEAGEDNGYMCLIMPVRLNA